MNMYDAIKTIAADTTTTPEAIRKEFEAAINQWEIERKEKAAADAKAKYASRLTEIANRMLNRAETAGDVAFILNAYLTDQLGKQGDEPYVTAKEMNSIIECMSALKEFDEAFASTTPTTNDDDVTISKFLNKLGL